MKRGRLVYTAGPGGPEEPPREPAAGEPATSVPAAKQDVRVRRETAGRGGKTVTTIAALQLTRGDVQDLLARLKRNVGSGGALKSSRAADGSPAWILELQGDHVDRLLAELTSLGFRAKRAGG
ncbi:MAG: translation initiation factor [Acidobacteria bacterium]|nr:translation initiation factor [Acidobacteriota bacterium]